MATFKEQLEADLQKVFFNTGLDESGRDSSEFGSLITHRPKDGYGEYVLSCIFDASDSDIQPQGDGFTKVQTKYIRIMIKESDLKSPLLVYDNMVLGEVVYLVVEAKSDGVGVMTIVLHGA